MINEDFLEVVESFTIANNQIITLGYRYHWTDSTKQNLRKCWDSVKHFPDLPNFPHHIHVGSESRVIAGQSRSIVELIEFIEGKLSEDVPSS